MKTPEVYIPIDRRHALAADEPLPDRAAGTVLFADISGFTPLTAALLKELGLKRGPEELTYWLNQVYDVLVDRVHRYGGSIIGFSGDAITCWLAGDDGRRGVACGLALQEAMGQFANIETAAGNISLSIKIAIANGPVRRFVVGYPAIQYQDVLAGSTLDRMAVAEHQANKQEVVVDPQIAANLADHLTVAEYRTDPQSGLRFAVVTGLALEVAETPWPSLPAGTPAAEPLRSWLLNPVYERLQSGQGQFLAEIRPVTPLFMRFGGINYDEDDRADQKLDAYLRWVQAILARYGGYLIQLTLGDKGCYLYATFGAPLTYGDEPLRAVAAAMALQALPSELDFIPPVQIGISQGRMRTGAYGGNNRATYGVLGDEVNIAARLMGRAEPGQIIISQRIAEAVRLYYRLDYIGPIPLKGKSEPLSVWQVLGRNTGQPQLTGLFTQPLIGREAELARLAQYLAAGAGAGCVIRLQGVAGIGKSHLAAEFVEHLRQQQDWQVVVGTGQSTAQDISYYPWRQIFRALFELDFEAGDPARLISQLETGLDRINPAWSVRLPLLADLLDLPIPDNDVTANLTPRLRRESLLSLAVDLLQHWSQAQPLLLWLDDAHWQDEASQALTMAAARITAQAPIALLLTHRPPLEEGRDILPGLEQVATYHRFDLEELSPAGIAALIEQRLDGAASPLVIGLVQSQARGNPFFAEELVDALLESGFLVTDEAGLWQLVGPLVTALEETNCLAQNEAGQPILNPDASLSAVDLGLPDSIQEVVLSRLDRLLEDQKLTIKVASVIGRLFEFRLLVASHPTEKEEDRLFEQVRVIEEREFSRVERPLPNLAYIFKHNIIRDVAYETLLERQRKDLHRIVAEGIEAMAPTEIEQLAYHYQQARVADKATHYLELAAHKAEREYANETALNYYRQALAFAERWQWQNGTVEMLHILGRRDEEQLMLQLLAANPEADPLTVAHQWGRYYEEIGDYPQAETALQEALAIAQERADIEKEAYCLAQFGLLARRQGDYEQAQNWYDQALALVEDESEINPDTRTYILNGLGTTLREQGQLSQAQSRCYQPALRLSRQTNNRVAEAEALNNLGVTAYYLRDFVEADTYFRQALEIRRTIGDRTGQAKSLYSLALIARERGRYDQTQTYLAEALNIAQAIGNRWDEVNINNDLGIFHMELGQLDQAQQHLQQGLALARQINDEVGQAYLLVNLGLAALETENLAEAETYLNNGLQLAQTHHERRLTAFYHHYLSQLHLARREWPQAIEQAEASLQLRQALDMRLQTPDVLATLALIHLEAGDLDRAGSYADQTHAILEECRGEGPEFPQHDYYACYRVFRAMQHEQAARSALEAAYNLVMNRADQIAEPSLRQIFLEQNKTARQIIRAWSG